MAQQGAIQNLNESQDEALQALLSSLGQGSSQNGSKLPADQVKKLSEKLEELMGNVGPADLSQPRNERGELVNEEGLPIIEVTEPLPEVEAPGSHHPTTIPDDADVIPLASLPADERERRRIERDRILDLLEQEESMQRITNEDPVEARRHETLQKRKENPQLDLERLKATREMQKKMGKALLRNMADAREKEEKAQEEAFLHDRVVEEQKKTLKPKKSVSFADLPPGAECEPKDRAKLREKEVRLDWGDVAPAKLRSANKTALMTKAQMNRHPMKMDVVERLPTVWSEPEQPKIHVQDSDDESAPSSPVPADSDGDAVVLSDREDEPSDVKAASGSDEDDAEDELGSEDEQLDLDSVRHHREIAFAYYEKRNVIGEGVAKAMTSHTSNVGEDEWDKPEVPLEATLSSPKPKPSVSRFKADRNTSLYDASLSASTPLGLSLPPSSESQTIRRAIRTGRLENDKLVGGESGESASEPEDENVKEVLELLKMGEVRNVGPAFGSATKPSASAPNQSVLASSPARTHQPLENIDHLATSSAQATAEAEASTSKPKVSKFKLNRTSGLRPALPDSTPSTPISTVGRSSPKLPEISPDGVDSSKSPPASVSNIGRSPVMFPPSRESPTVDSPSFPKSTVIVSPSFPPPRQTRSNADTVPTASGSRLERPPTVMSAAVLESSGNSSKAPMEVGKGKKISRFMAERI